MLKDSEETLSFLRPHEEQRAHFQSVLEMYALCLQPVFAVNGKGCVLAYPGREVESGTEADEW